MEQKELPGVLYQRLAEAAKIAIEKCVNENRLTKDNFDKVYMELYTEAWKNFEYIRGRI